MSRIRRIAEVHPPEGDGRRDPRDAVRHGARVDHGVAECALREPALARTSFITTCSQHMCMMYYVFFTRKTLESFWQGTLFVYVVLRTS